MTSEAGWRQKILDWLTSIDYGARQTDSLVKKHPGTSSWVLRSSVYGNFINGSNTNLLFQGAPGVGKTIISSVVIQDLITRFEQDESVGIAYVYFDRLRRNEQHPEDIFMSLIKQLVQRRLAVPGNVDNMYRLNGRSSRPKWRRILDCVRSTILEYARVILIFDGINEYSEVYRDKLLKELLKMQAECGLSLFVTSRPDERLTGILESFSSLEIRAHDDDLRKFIAENICRMQPFLSEESNGFHDEVVQKLVQMANGRFELNSGTRFRPYSLTF